MRSPASNIVATATLVIAAAQTSVGPAFAVIDPEPCFVCDITTVGVPGPVAGVGLPAIVLVGGAAWLIRRIRRGKQVG
jgi:uncharacterized membrane protein